MIDRVWRHVLLVMVVSSYAMASDSRIGPFKNNHIESVERPLLEVLRWQWNAYQQGLPKPAMTPTPITPPNIAQIHDYPRGMHGAQPSASPALTWIGHATMLVQAGGLNILTDPVFSERASPFSLIGPKRAQPPGVALGDLPPIDVVLISHNHYDHLDRYTIEALHQKANEAGLCTLFLVPLGLKQWFTDMGIDHVQELDWWQQVSVGGVAFYFTPTQHWSARGLADQNASLWGAWAVLSQDLHWYFAGDTGYSPDFKATQAHFAPQHTQALGGGFDLALIPIGAYEPRWFMAAQHINPEEAMQIHADLGAKRSVGIHWGTFPLTDEALDQPPQDLALARERANRAPEDFSVMKIGETQLLPRRVLPNLAQDTSYSTILASDDHACSGSRAN